MQPVSVFFPNAQDLTIAGGSFNHVQGDQHNSNRTTVRLLIPNSKNTIEINADELASIIQEIGLTTTTVVNNIQGNQYNHVNQQENTERTMFDDYGILKRGDICRHRDIFVDDFSERCKCEACIKHRVIKTYSVAKVNAAQGNFTVASYSGPGARKAFEEDFQRVSSGLESTLAQVYAVDIGSVPSMVYWNELVPAKVLKGSLGSLGKICLYDFCHQWICDPSELWMDTGRGVVCRGPLGPSPHLTYWNAGIRYVPSTVNLLQKDALLHFLSSFKSKDLDQRLMNSLAQSYVRVEHASAAEMCNQPTAISTLTQTPISVANNVWESRYGSLSETSYLENGLTRFRFDGHETDFTLELNLYAGKSWLAQASSVLHALGIGANQGDIKLVRRRAWLDGYVYDSQPVYLFVRPPPPNLPNGYTSSLHYWSFEQDGCHPISAEICNKLRLPTDLEFRELGYYSYSWPSDTYKLLPEYQLARGFDPTNSNFARHLEYENIFHPLNDANRFEEIDEGSTSTCPMKIDGTPERSTFLLTFTKGWFCRKRS